MPPGQPSRRPAMAPSRRSRGPGPLQAPAPWVRAYLAAPAEHPTSWRRNPKFRKIITAGAPHSHSERVRMSWGGGLPEPEGLVSLCPPPSAHARCPPRTQHPAGALGPFPVGWIRAAWSARSRGGSRGSPRLSSPRLSGPQLSGARPSNRLQRAGLNSSLRACARDITPMPGAGVMVQRCPDQVKGARGASFGTLPRPVKVLAVPWAAFLGSSPSSAGNPQEQGAGSGFGPVVPILERKCGPRDSGATQHRSTWT